jgi:hypothetical protein
MKLLAILLVTFSMSALAAGDNTPLSYEQLATFKVNDSMCSNIDYYINFLERQLKLKGLSNATPEELNDDDRKYNAEARIAIWALRIGCNNPDRYK